MGVGRLRTVLLWFMFGVLPVLLTFAATSAHYEGLFTAGNMFYDGMLVAVCISIPLTHHWNHAVLPSDDSSSEAESGAFTAFQIALPTLVAILSFAAGFPAAGGIWLVFAILLAVASVALLGLKGICRSWAPDRARGCGLWAYSVLLFMVATGFIAFPVARSWSGRPQDFVRWHPYSTSGELVWRGIFACYALGMYWTAIEGPGQRQRCFVRYLAVSGLLHATVMLIMNLSARGAGAANGNAEHLYGDIAGWYLVGVVSAVVLWCTSGNQPPGSVSAKPVPKLANAASVDEPPTVVVDKL
jgi:hypothetical protein